MSARQVERLKRQSELEQEDAAESEEDVEELPQKKSGFNFLLDDSDEEDDPAVEENEEVIIETPASKPIVKASAKQKKKSNKKASKPSSAAVAESETKQQDEDDAFTTILEEAATATQTQQQYSWLQVQTNDLSIDAVLLRRFGAAVLHENDKKQANGRQRYLLRKYLFGPPKQEWQRPPHLIIRCTELSPQEYKFTWSEDYQRLNDRYIQVQRTGDVNILCTFLSQNPYHIEGFLQLSMVFARTGHMDKASECVRLALFVIEHCLPETSKLLAGCCRMDAALPENTALFSALFRHAQMCCMLGCPTVSAAMSLLLLSLDPEGDPFHVLLCLDFYLLASGNHTTLDAIMTEQEDSLLVGPSPIHPKPLAEPEPVRIRHLPNWVFTLAISKYQREDSAADELLCKALRDFPFMLRPILTKIDVNVESVSPLDWRRVCNADIFRLARSRLPSSCVLEHIADIYAARNKSFWQREVMTRWLFKCCSRVVEQAEEAAVMQRYDYLANLATKTHVKKYSHANIEDYLEEFPRLPPEANPLDPRFLVPGAPVVQPVRHLQQQQRAMLNGRGGEEEDFLDLDLIQQLIQAEEAGHQGLGRHPNFMGQRNAPGNLGPDQPLMQLFLQTMMPWNMFDPQVREDDDEDGGEDDFSDDDDM